METSFTQTTINNHKVTIFNHLNGTQLFINDPAGNQIYAHKVSGDALERAKAIINASSPETFEASAPVQADKMICLSERKAEFVEATLRGKDNQLEVYAGWDKDTFVVVNRDNSAEYEVRLETRDGRTFADCTCKDFEFRRRFCKHQSAVMVDLLLSVAVRN